MPYMMPTVLTQEIFPNMEIDPNDYRQLLYIPTPVVEICEGNILKTFLQS